MLFTILQAAPATGGSPNSLISFMPIVLIGIIFYFLLIRPQNKRMKEHRVMLSEIQRGDQIVTNGGLIGKVTKVNDDELVIDLGEGTKVKAMRSMIATVRNRTEPANDRAKPAAKAKSKK